MENFNDSKPDLLSADGLQVDEQSGAHLKDAGTWAKAVAVIVSIIGGLVVLLVLAYGNMFSGIIGMGFQAYAGIFIIIVLIVLVIALIGIINLFRFSNGMATGINNQDAVAFDKGMGGLKIYLILMGVLALLTAFFTIIKLITG